MPPVSLVLATRSAQYVGGLEEYRFRDVIEWPAFFSVAMIAAARAARDLALRIEELADAWLERLGNPRSDASSRTIIDRLAAEPIITIIRAAELAGGSGTAADNATRALDAAGILTRIDEQRWGRRWEATDVLALLDDFERELATPDGDHRAMHPAPRAP